MPKFRIITSERLTRYRVYEIEIDDDELSEDQAACFVGAHSVSMEPQPGVVMLDEEVGTVDSKHVDEVINIDVCCPHCFIEWKRHGLQPINCCHRKEEFE